MRSSGLFLAAALALSDVISLADGIPNTKNVEAAHKGSGDNSKSGTKPAAGPKSSTPRDCFSLHMSATGTIKGVQYNVDSDAELSPLIKASWYRSPVFAPSGTGGNIIWHVNGTGNAIAQVGDEEMVLTQQHAIGFSGVVGLYLSPTKGKIDKGWTLSSVSVDIGKPDGFKVKDGVNMACITYYGQLGYTIGKLDATGAMEICIKATMSAKAANCAK